MCVCVLGTKYKTSARNRAGLNPDETKEVNCYSINWAVFQGKSRAGLNPDEAKVVTASTINWAHIQEFSLRKIGIQVLTRETPAGSLRAEYLVLNCQY